MPIIYESPEGLCIVYPTGELPIEEVVRKDVPLGVPYRIVSDEAIPTDSTFRDAWVADTDKPDEAAIKVDLVKARGIARRMIEEEFGELSVRQNRTMDPAVRAAADRDMENLQARWAQADKAPTFEALTALLSKTKD